MPRSAVNTSACQKFVWCIANISIDCGNSTSAGTVAPTADCGMTCKGNSSEYCGAGNRLSIYWNGKTPPVGPSTNPGVNGFGFLGCYT